MLGVIITLLLIVHVVVCLLISVLVLMQRPRKDGLGAAFGGGMADTMFGAQTTNVLQKGTVFLAGLFFAITLTLALLLAKQQRQLSARDAAILGTGDIAAETGDAAEEQADAPVEVDPQLPPPVEEAPTDSEPATGAEVEPSPDSEASTAEEAAPVVDEPTGENEPAETEAPATDESVEPAEPASTDTEEQG